MRTSNSTFLHPKNYLYSKPVKGLHGCGVGYRFSFNGKEKDNEGMGGGGSTYDYGFRIYNAQLGKFLSVDPLTKSYPWYTPYQFAGNKPIEAIDLDGKEEENYLVHLLKAHLGLGPKPKTAEEAYEQENEKNAVKNVLNDIEKLADVHEKVYGSFVPGYSAAIQFARHNYGSAIFLGAFDVVGGKIIGGLFKGASKVGFNYLFKTPLNVVNVFENAGVNSFKFVLGSSGKKTAVIGQGMDRVKDIAKNLAEPEIFKPSATSIQAWDKLVASYKGKQIPDKVVKETALYKENVKWIADIKEKGYNIIDIGADKSGKESTFYNMEKVAVHGDK